MKVLYAIIFSPLIFGSACLVYLVIETIENLEGGLNEARFNHTAVMMQDGSVLVEGGFIKGQDVPHFENQYLQTLVKFLYTGNSQDWKTLTSAEIFDRHTGYWKQTGKLLIGRACQSTTLLPNGRVLLAGGLQMPDNKEMNECELFEPKSGTWHVTGAMNTARFGHISLLLKTGKVLAIAGYQMSEGGSGEMVPIAKCELYDPSTGTWQKTGSLPLELEDASVNPLSDGSVLVIGGTLGWSSNKITIGSSMRYNPRVGLWENVSPMKHNRSATATELLKNGKLLVAGGESAGEPIASCELFDPVTGKWSDTGNLLEACYYAGLFCLPSGEVLLIGGCTSDDHAIPDCELYNPTTGTWHSAGRLRVPRRGFDLTLLNDGKVLVTAGTDNENRPLYSCEIYNPATNSWSAP